MARGLNIIFGGARFGNPSSGGFDHDEGTDEAARQVFEVLKKNNVTTIDSARIYGNSEEALGRLKAGTEEGFTIDTKWHGGWRGPGQMTKERIISDTKDSLAKLGMSKVHIFHFHSPDTETPLEEQLAGVDAAYQMGAFEKFGLSNYTPAQVQAVYDVCKEKGYVLPTVYQGLYSPVNRKAEEELLPLLRKLGIAFNSYSPLAGGFLTKSRTYVQNGEGRFDKTSFAGLYGKLYDTPAYLDALEEWEKIADEEDVSKAAMAYRWVNYHSPLKPDFGDGMIIGGRLTQLSQLFQALNDGPLSDSAAGKIEQLWKKLAPHAQFMDNFDAAVAAGAVQTIEGKK